MVPLCHWGCYQHNAQPNICKVVSLCHSFNIVNRRIGSIFFWVFLGYGYQFVCNTSKRENMYNLGMVMQSGRVVLRHFFAWIKSKGSRGAIRPSMGVWELWSMVKIGGILGVQLGLFVDITGWQLHKLGYNPCKYTYVMLYPLITAYYWNCSPTSPTSMSSRRFHGDLGKCQGWVSVGVLEPGSPYETIHDHCRTPVGSKQAIVFFLFVSFHFFPLITDTFGMGWIGKRVLFPQDFFRECRRTFFFSPGLPFSDKFSNPPEKQLWMFFVQLPWCRSALRPCYPCYPDQSSIVPII